ncbi:hypothetical protein ACHAXT_006582 [Thalassiosira profunda]
MHGQKRAEYKSRLLNPEAAAKLATKARQWNHLSRELLAQRRRLLGPPAPSEEGAAAEGDDAALVPPSPGILLALTEKMLSVNPDPSHLWNVRREMLLCAPPAAGAPSKEGENEAEGAEEPNAHAKRSSFDIEAELKLTAHCLQRNPKSYSSWFHRKWALVYHLTHGAPSPAIASPTEESSLQKQHVDGTKSILQAELELCAQFLQLDERNFHCWNYRRFVVALRGSCGRSGASSAPREGDAAKSDMELFSGSWSSWLEPSEVSMGAQLSKSAGTAKGILPTGNEGAVDGETDIANSIAPLSKEELEKIITDEWDFTTSKIQDNFSNGSAFHYRSKLLPLMLASRAPSGDAGDRHDAILSLAREEWENILLNAIFTEPDDQTPWWYLRCIVSWARPSAEWNEELSEEYEALLFEMADSLRELLEVEKENGMATGEGGVRDESKGAKCKWGYIGLHLVLSTLLESKLIDEDEREELREEAKDCFEQAVNAKYPSSKGHIALLRERSGVMFEVDATRLHVHPDLSKKKFDVILFTFPHTGVPNFAAGCSGPNPKSIDGNKQLIRDFLRSAQKILANDGEINITLKTSAPYDRWTFPDFADYEIEAKSQHNFRAQTFPGYSHRSTKGHIDLVKNGHAKTYVFGRKRKHQGTAEEEVEFARVEEEDIETFVIEVLSGDQNERFNVLDIRRRFPEAILPDTRQLNRVLYAMESRKLLKKGSPNAWNKKPTWALTK